MPVSPELGHIFMAATALAEESHHNHVEPPHLLRRCYRRKPRVWVTF